MFFCLRNNFYFVKDIVMSASDFFPWLPDWGAGVGMKYRFDTVIDSGETGNEQARLPLFNTLKRTQSCTHFSPEYLSNIETFLREHHADFFPSSYFFGAYGPRRYFWSAAC